MISLLGIGVLIYVVFILIIQLSDLAIFEVGEKLKKRKELEKNDVRKR